MGDTDKIETIRYRFFPSNIACIDILIDTITTPILIKTHKAWLPLFNNVKIINYVTNSLFLTRNRFCKIKVLFYHELVAILDGICIFVKPYYCKLHV